MVVDCISYFVGSWAYHTFFTGISMSRLECHVFVFCLFVFNGKGNCKCYRIKKSLFMWIMPRLPLLALTSSPPPPKFSIQALSFTLVHSSLSTSQASSCSTDQRECCLGCIINYRPQAHCSWQTQGMGVQLRNSCSGEKMHGGRI